MIIEIGNHKIITDDRQFIVQERKVVQAAEGVKPENVGKEYWQNVAYCRTLQHALKHVSTKAILRNNEAKAILAELMVIEKKIDEFIKLLK